MYDVVDIIYSYDSYINTERLFNDRHVKGDGSRHVEVCIRKNIIISYIFEDTVHEFHRFVDIFIAVKGIHSIEFFRRLYSDFLTIS